MRGEEAVTKDWSRTLQTDLFDSQRLSLYDKAVPLDTPVVQELTLALPPASKAVPLDTPEIQGFILALLRRSTLQVVIAFLGGMPVQLFGSETGKTLPTQLTLIGLIFFFFASGCRLRPCSSTSSWILSAMRKPCW